ncbi:hypothetical protein AX16_003194 [Volvariella volvacea WC 439]|nr:hypothetical protein AX16_003194 [Volvariella volvacea WC 439]
MVIRPRLLPVDLRHLSPHKACNARTFLSFPSPFSSPPGELQTYRERKLFPYGQNQLYNIVADVASYPHFVPFCTASRMVKPPITRIGSPVSVMEAELTVGFLNFTESYVSTVTCTPYTEVKAVASSSTPLFKTLNTIWKFEPVTTKSLQHPVQGPTWVSLELEYAFTNPLHAAVSSTFFGQVSKLMVKAFEDRCHEVYRPMRP